MKENYLTIGDVKNFKCGDKEKFLCIDRNFYEFLYKNKGKREMSPADFFSNCYILKYTHINSVNGIGLWNFSPIERHFIFEINYKKSCWYPLNSHGTLPNKDFEGCKLSWNEYSDNTLLGWRGPMLRWSDVINGPNISY